MPGLKRCPDCYKLVRIETTVAGRSIPLDPKPTSTGNYVLERARSESGVEVGARRARMLKHGERVEIGAELFTTHFATCPKKRKQAS